MLGYSPSPVSTVLSLRAHSSLLVVARAWKLDDGVKSYVVWEHENSCVCVGCSSTCGQSCDNIQCLADSRARCNLSSSSV